MQKKCPINWGILLLMVPSLTTFLGGPILIWILAKMRVVEALLARHLAAYPRGELYPLFLRRKLHFGNDKALILAKELINLDGVARIVDIVKGTSSNFSEIMGCKCSHFLSQVRYCCAVNMPAHGVNYIRWAACPSIVSKTLRYFLSLLCI